MDFKFSEEQEMFRQAIRDFAQKEVSPLVAEAEATEKFPIEILKKSGNLGYLCPMVAREYGGGGMDLVAACISNEEVAKIDLGIAETYMMAASYIAPALEKYGTEKQKQKYLVPAVKGEKIGGFALTEHVGGSNPAANESIAVKKGDKYILNGSKTFCTNAVIADFLLMYVYTNKAAGPGKGMSCFILDTKSRGVTITGMKKVGSLPSSEGDLFFDNVEIPAENLLGEEGKAYGPVLWLVGINRATHAARGLGVAEAAFDFALDYAKQRVVFGQPIAKHEYLSFKFAKMATQIEAVRSMVYRAAWLYDQNDESWPKLAAMAKLMSGETAQWVTGEAMQMQGGYGLMMDSPLQRYWRDSKFLAITEGTLEVLQIVISRALGIK